MKVFSVILLLISFYHSALLAQTSNPVINLQKNYELFNYATVVSEASNLLKDKQRLSKENIISITTLKAAAQFSMGENESTRKSFIEILKLDQSFELNNIAYSPKMVSFFKNIKSEFHDVLTLNDNIPKIKSRIKNEDNRGNATPLKTNNFNSSFAKSLLLPGWGHFEIGQQTKGWILTFAGIATLSSAIYFIFDTNNKELNYLSSKNNTTLININYDKYNKSYKIRNTLIATYAAVWLYAQMDLLFFSGDLGSENIQANSYGDNSSITPESVTLSLKIPF